MAECVRPKKPETRSGGDDVRSGNSDVTGRYDVQSSGHADKLNNALPTVDDSYDSVDTGAAGEGYDDKQVPSNGVTNDGVTIDGGDVSSSSQYASSSASSRVNADSSSLQSDVTTDYPKRLVVALPELDNQPRDVTIPDRDVIVPARDVTVAPLDVGHPGPSAPALDPGEPPGYCTDQYDAVIFYNQGDYHVAATFQDEIERVCRARGYDPSMALFHEDLRLGKAITRGATNFMRRSNFWFFLISDRFVGDKFLNAVHDDAMWEQWDSEECDRSRVPVYTKDGLKGSLPFVRGVKSIEFLDMKLGRFAEKTIIKAFLEDEMKKAERHVAVERDRRIWKQDRLAEMLAAATRDCWQQELTNRNAGNRAAVRPAPAIEPLRLQIQEPTRRDSMNSIAATINSSMDRLSLDSQVSSDVSQDISRLDSLDTPEPIDASSVAVTSTGQRPMDLRSNPGGPMEASPDGSPARGEESSISEEVARVAQGTTEEEGALEGDVAQTGPPAGPLSIPSVATDASGNAQINIELDENDDLILVPTSLADHDGDVVTEFDQSAATHVVRGGGKHDQSDASVPMVDSDWLWECIQVNNG